MKIMLVKSGEAIIKIPHSVCINDMTTSREILENTPSLPKINFNNGVNKSYPTETEVVVAMTVSGIIIYHRLGRRRTPAFQYQTNVLRHRAVQYIVPQLEEIYLPAPQFPSEMK